MIILEGSAVAPGFAAGKALVYGPGHRRRPAKRKIDADLVSKEIQRFEDARRASLRETEALQRKVRAEIGDSESLIFEAHLALLEDRQFVDGVKNLIDQERVSAAHAVDRIAEDLAEKLSRVKNDYLRERTEDIRDVGGRILTHLAGGNENGSSTLEHLPFRTVLIARELLPSDTIKFDREKVIGIVTEQGGAQSHSAILARAMGIPAVTGVSEATSLIHSGQWLLVDGARGQVTVAPSARQSAAFARSQHAREDIADLELREESFDCRTADGEKINLHGNIGRVEEADLIEEHYLSGIGLFRTEFLFLDTRDRPSLRTQFSAYREVVCRLEGLPTTIRTLDFGGDKHPAFLNRSPEGNPSLGLRGLRLSLAEEGLLKTQLRAALRASKFGPVRLLFPMVLGEADLHRAIAITRNAAALEDLAEIPQIGSMIETPAAVFQIDRILDLVDFISIGSNDLTQFILAADRDSIEMVQEHSVLHPAVLNAIHQVVVAAHKRGKPVSVCGEAAGDPDLACLLMGLGVRDLSMGPLRAAKVRHRLRRQSLRRWRKIAAKCLAASSAADVRQEISQHS